MFKKNNEKLFLENPALILKRSDMVRENTEDD